MRKPDTAPYYRYKIWSKYDPAKVVLGMNSVHSARDLISKYKSLGYTRNRNFMSRKALGDISKSNNSMMAVIMSKDIPHGKKTIEIFCKRITTKYVLGNRFPKK